MQMKRLIIFLIFLFICSGFICFQNALDAAERPSLAFAEVENVVPSPSERFLLSLVAQKRSEIQNREARQYTLQICDNNEMTEWLIPTTYRVRDRVLVTWDDQKDCIWARDGDTGIYFWEFDDALGVWTQMPYTEYDNLENLPAALRDEIGVLV